MNGPDSDRRPPGPAPLRSVLTDLLVAAVLAVVGAATLFVSVSRAPGARVDLGPTDASYREGFRDDWERDGTTYFRWTRPTAAVRVPVSVSGAPGRLELRVRRHLIEPADLTVFLDQVPLIRERVDAGPYRVLSGRLPPTSGQPVRLRIATTSADPRPLGIALDWLAIRTPPGSSLRPLPATAWQLAAWLVAAFVGVRLAGASRILSTATGLVLVFGVAGAGWDPVAAERILREGWTTAVPLALGAGLVLCSRRARAALGIESPCTAGWLAATVVLGFALRALLVLHPRLYYPDVTVHARFAAFLAKHGLAEFMREFVANQFRFSLGLQFEHGHWYAFPYPPAYYLLTWPWVALSVAPEVAVGLAAAAVNALQPLVVFGIGRRLGLSRAVALAGAFLTPILPIFVVRLSLAYFPALTGQAADSLVLVALAGLVAGPPSGTRRYLAYAVGLALALLTYTQSLLNFALLVPIYLALEWRRSPQARGQCWRLAGATVLGGLLALGIFYGRYVPVAVDMARGVPMPEESLLLDLMQRRAEVHPEEAVPETPDDPHAGPGLDLGRGLRKAGARLWIFYGPFVFAVALGLVLVIRQVEGAPRRLVVAWAATYVLLNLASGGLPGPNLVRYHKDIEIVAPLCALTLGAVASALGGWRRAAGWLACASFWTYGAIRFVEVVQARWIGS